MNSILSNNNRRDYFILLAICLFSFCFDFLWISQHERPPAWDQASHLATAFDTRQLFRLLNIFNHDWWNQLWAKFPTYRGPFTYLVSLPFISLFGSSYKIAILSNQLFNWLIIFSTYFLGKVIYHNKAGLWASFLCSVSPALLNQRTDYLIDLSLVSVITTSWLFISIWHYDTKFNKWIAAIISGIFLGLVFLTRPTGLVFLWLPFVLIIRKIIIDLLNNRILPFVQFVLAITLGFIISWPWFSSNWLTILLSINKARQWGIRYQDGLEVDTLEGWLYYPMALPSLLGGLMLGLLLTGVLLNLYQKLILNSEIHNFSKLKINNIFWWLSFPLGGLLICILMSTKDLRFLLPLAPQIFILCGILITSINRNWSYSWKISLIISGILGLFWNQFGLGLNVTGINPHSPGKERWPLPQIVERVVKVSPYQLSTIAVLTDSKYLNAFNLDAEGKRQNNLVAARQTYYQTDKLTDELANFDWFLIKTGDKGIMSGDREAEIGKLIINSNSFTLDYQWSLPDNSQAYLYRRKPLSLDISKVRCTDASSLINLKKIPNGLELSYLGKLNNDHLLIDFKANNRKFTADQSLGKGLIRTGKNNQGYCFQLVQRMSAKMPDAINYDDFEISLNVIDKRGKDKNISLSNNKLLDVNFNTDKNYSIGINRIDEVKKMGLLLQEGEIDKLFAKVGQVNQGDPEQVYLQNSEIIIKKRLEKEPNDLDNLYSLAVAQTVQKKANDASKTLNKICKLDKFNTYPLIAKAIVDIYRFEPELARISIDKAILLNDDSKLVQTLDILESISNLLSFNFLEVLT